MLGFQIAYQMKVTREAYSWLWNEWNHKWGAVIFGDQAGVWKRHGGKRQCLYSSGFIKHQTPN